MQETEDEICEKLFSVQINHQNNISKNMEKLCKAKNCLKLKPEMPIFCASKQLVVFEKLWKINYRVWMNVSLVARFCASRGKTMQKKSVEKL